MKTDLTKPLDWLKETLNLRSQSSPRDISVGTILPVADVLSGGWQGAEVVIWSGQTSVGAGQEIDVDTPADWKRGSGYDVRLLGASIVIDASSAVSGNINFVLQLAGINRPDQLRPPIAEPVFLRSSEPGSKVRIRSSVTATDNPAPTNLVLEGISALKAPITSEIDAQWSVAFNNMDAGVSWEPSFHYVRVPEGGQVPS